MGTNGTPKGRLSINLSGQAREELEALSKKHSRSMTELMRLGLGVVKLLLQEAEQNHKIIVTTANGTPIKEIVLPGI